MGLVEAELFEGFRVRWWREEEEFVVGCGWELEEDLVGGDRESLGGGRESGGLRLGFRGSGVEGTGEAVGF